MAICIRDIWAIGVITYFLLCGYTPFDRDSNLDEMQAILIADYKFEPAEYWRGVSENGIVCLPELP
jgi:calcium/calmodulin-dependent protein kinase I